MTEPNPATEQPRSKANIDRVDVFAVGGAVCLAAGAAWAYPPAGPMVLGVLLLVGAVLSARNGG